MDDAPAIDGHAGALVITGRLGSVHTLTTARAGDRFTDVISSVRHRSGVAVWDRVAAAVTHRRSWTIALLIADWVIVRAAEIQSAIIATPGVVSVSDEGASASGLTQWKVILDTSPGSTDAFKTVAALREWVTAPDPRALVGGSDAQALDARDAAVRTVVIPALFTVIGPRIWWPVKVDNTFR